jgi:hypothetical protein
VRKPLRHRIPGTRKIVPIKGWRVTYYVPTHGSQEWFEDDPRKLAKAKKWLDAGGYSYKVRPVFI